MEQHGLRPVSNPSELLISPNEENLAGSSIASTIEGIRPLLIETQALVSTSVYGHPQRSATGFDNRRLSMLLAVLEKKCHLYFSQNDVFLNLAGGIKVTDPAIDLAIVAALISSLQDIPIPRRVCFAGEVGLSGEIRAVNRIEQRIIEAENAVTILATAKKSRRSKFVLSTTSPAIVCTNKDVKPISDNAIPIYFGDHPILTRYIP